MISYIIFIFYNGTVSTNQMSFAKFSSTAVKSNMQTELEIFQ